MNALVKVLVLGSGAMSALLVLLMCLCVLATVVSQYIVWKDRVSSLKAKSAISFALMLTTLWGSYLTYQVSLISWELIQYLR
jgi:hypothetical protein